MIISKKEWLSAYTNEKWLRLLDRAYDNIMANITCEGMPWAPLRGISPGRGTFFPGIWNWDTAFHAMCVSRWDTELAKECLWAFMQFQKENGMYPDVIWKEGGMFDGASKPPVLATYVLLTFERDGELAFLKKCYASLKKNLEFWEKERYASEGLFYYSAAADNAEEQDLWARWESGWDDSVRWDVGIEKLYPIDLQCYMITFYRAMQKMATILGEENQAWAEKEAALSRKINDLFFDEKQGIYVDIFKSDKKKSAVYSPASFMPLYIGIAPQEFAQKCAEFAKKHFYPAMPTVAYDDPCYVGEYWRGHTWLNVAYFAIKGLKDYHFDTLAEEMRNTILSYVEKNKEHIFEKYDADNGEGRGCPCFSWSSAFIIEFILNF